MILQAECDRCGVVMEGGYTDWDGEDLCRSCKIKKELQYLEQQRKELKEWLKSVHFKELEELNKKIIKLKEELKGEK